MFSKKFSTNSNENGRALLVFNACMVVFGLGTGTIFNFLAPYLKSLGVTESLIGILVSLGAFGAMLVSMPGGRLADTFGPRVAIMIYIGAAGAISALFPVLVFPAAAMSLYVAYNATTGLNMPSTTPYIYGTTKSSNRGKGMSLYMVTTYIGHIIGPILGGFLADRYGMKAAFLACAVVCAAAFAVATRLPKTAPQEVSKIKARNLIFNLSDIREMFKVRGFKGLVFRGVALQFLNGISMTVLSIFVLYHLGLSKQSAGLVFGIASFAALLTTPLGGYLSDRIGRKYPVIIGCLVGAVCFSLVPFALLAPSDKRFLMICILEALQSAGFALSNPSVMALMSETMPRERIGTGMGVYYTIATIGWVAGAPIAGVIFEANPMMPFALGGLVTIVSVLIFMRFVPETSSNGQQISS